MSVSEADQRPEQNSCSTCTSSTCTVCAGNATHGRLADPAAHLPLIDKAHSSPSAVARRSNFLFNASEPHDPFHGVPALTGSLLCRREGI